jgi:hypothetical protein
MISFNMMTLAADGLQMLDAAPSSQLARQMSFMVASVCAELSLLAGNLAGAVQLAVIAQV